MSRSRILWIIVGILSISGVGWAETPTRHPSRMQSLLPAEGLPVVEELGANGQTTLVEVSIRAAEVVRVWRDADEPWLWRERSTRIHRLPAGMFVVVIGREAASGVVYATGVEVPDVSRATALPRP